MTLEAEYAQSRFHGIMSESFIKDPEQISSKFRSIKDFLDFYHLSDSSRIKDIEKEIVVDFNKKISLIYLMKNSNPFMRALNFLFEKENFKLIVRFLIDERSGDGIDNHFLIIYSDMDETVLTNRQEAYNYLAKRLSDPYFLSLLAERQHFLINLYLDKLYFEDLYNSSTEDDLKQELRKEINFVNIQWMLRLAMNYHQNEFSIDQKHVVCGSGLISFEKLSQILTLSFKNYSMDEHKISFFPLKYREILSKSYSNSHTFNSTIFDQLISFEVIRQAKRLFYFTHNLNAQSYAFVKLMQFEMTLLISHLMKLKLGLL